MPMRPLRPCPSPGCQELVRKGRCPKHEAARHRAIDERRAPSAKRYPKFWPSLSRRILAEEILCRSCSTPGHPVPAAEVDHIDGNTWNCSRENLQALCKSCHSRKTMNELNARRNH